MKTQANAKEKQDGQKIIELAINKRKATNRRGAISPTMQCHVGIAGKRLGAQRLGLTENQRALVFSVGNSAAKWLEAALGELEYTFARGAGVGGGRGRYSTAVEIWAIK